MQKADDARWHGWLWNTDDQRWQLVLTRASLEQCGRALAQACPHAPPGHTAMTGAGRRRTRRSGRARRGSDLNPATRADRIHGAERRCDG